MGDRFLFRTHAHLCREVWSNPLLAQGQCTRTSGVAVWGLPPNSPTRVIVFPTDEAVTPGSAPLLSPLLALVLTTH